jgi:hypothetical protein
MAVSMAKRLNTEGRRDLAFIAALNAYCAPSNTWFSIAEALSIVGEIRDADHARGSAVLGLVRGLAEGNRAYSRRDIHDMKAAVEQLPNPYGRALAHAWLAVWLWGSSTDAPEEAERAQLECSNLDEQWRAVEAEFAVSGILAKVDTNSARAALKRARSNRATHAGHDSLLTPLLIEAIGLAIISAGALARLRADIEIELGQMLDLIRQVPALGAQVDLSARLAVRLYGADRRALGDQIVCDVVIPAFEAMCEAKDGHARNTHLSISLPPLWNTTETI